MSACDYSNDFLGFFVAVHVWKQDTILCIVVSLRCYFAIDYIVAFAATLLGQRAILHVMAESDSDEKAKPEEARAPCWTSIWVADIRY